MLRPLFAERKSGARIYGPHEQTEANSAQPRERQERKRAAIDAAIESEEPLMTGLTTEELEELLA